MIKCKLTFLLRVNQARDRFSRFLFALTNSTWVNKEDDDLFLNTQIMKLTIYLDTSNFQTNVIEAASYEKLPRHHGRSVVSTFEGPGCWADGESLLEVARLQIA